MKIPKIIEKLIDRKLIKKEKIEYSNGIIYIKWLLTDGSLVYLEHNDCPDEEDEEF